MDILTSLRISFFGFLVVFVTLALIFLCIKILSAVIRIFDRGAGKTPDHNDIKQPGTAGQNLPGNNQNEIDNSMGYGELKLYGVDEKTAAMIMAIVSDESQIPLSELRFKSIKLLDN